MAASDILVTVRVPIPVLCMPGTDNQIELTFSQVIRLRQMNRITECISYPMVYHWNAYYEPWRCVEQFVRSLNN